MGSFSMMHWLIILIIFALWVVPQVFFILSVQTALRLVDDEFRQVTPGLAWLLFIPVFNLIWIFFLVTYMRRGYEKMWENQRLSRETSAGFGLGIGFGVASVFCLIPGLNLIAWLPALVLWILYWVQVSQLKALVKPR